MVLETLASPETGAEYTPPPRCSRRFLVANRGEIAIRIIRALEELGIASVAVYSEADREALHVARADEAYLLGPAPAAESYLKIDRILEVVAESGRRGRAPRLRLFWPRTPPSPKALEDAGIVFIGPPASAIEAMGSKTRARDLMKKAGVPIIPGTTEGRPRRRDRAQDRRRRDRLPDRGQGPRAAAAARASASR